MKRVIYLLFFMFILQSSLSAQWIQLPDFQTSNVQSIVTDGTNLFALVHLQGVFVSSDDGVSWVSRSSGFNLFGNIKITIFGDTLWAFGNSLQKMSLSDTSWTTVSTPLIPISLFVEGNIIMIGSTQLLRSTDFGVTWTHDTLGGFTSIESFGLEGSAYFAGSSYGDIWRSTDVGVTWTHILQTPTGQFVYTFYSHSSGLYAGTDPGALRSSDNGLTWFPVNSFLIGDVYTFVSSGPTLIAGTQGGGVYTSTDPTTGWTPANLGFSFNPFVSSLVIKGANIFAGRENGIWKRPLGEISSVEMIDNLLPNQFNLSQNYPNPFNPETTIEFSIPQSEFVRLSISNILGENIETLVFEELAVGNYKIKWNAANYPSGVYIVNIKSGSFSQSRKIILQK